MIDLSQLAPGSLTASTFSFSIDILIKRYYRKDAVKKFIFYEYSINLKRLYETSESESESVFPNWTILK